MAGRLQNIYPVIAFRVMVNSAVIHKVLFASCKIKWNWIDWNWYCSTIFVLVLWFSCFLFTIERSNAQQTAVPLNKSWQKFPMQDLLFINRSYVSDLSFILLLLQTSIILIMSRSFTLYPTITLISYLNRLITANYDCICYKLRWQIELR